MKRTKQCKIMWLLIMAAAFILLSGCDSLLGPEEDDESAGGTDGPTETAIGFYNGSISGSAGAGDWVGLVPLTAGVEYRISLSGLSAEVVFVVREGTPSNIGTVVDSKYNNGSSSANITFTATQRNYVAGIQLQTGSGTSYSLTTYEIR